MADHGNAASISEETPLRRITTDSDIFGGKSILRGHRLAVEHVLGLLAAGDSPETILAGYAFLEPHADGDGELTNVWCWRRPNRRPCRGEIVARLENGSGEIVWHCPSCGVNGFIRGWEASLWDQRRSV
jgi:uncharacterized protein (DUF433 family)